MGIGMRCGERTPCLRALSLGARLHLQLIPHVEAGEHPNVCVAGSRQRCQQLLAHRFVEWEQGFHPVGDLVLAGGTREQRSGVFGQDVRPMSISLGSTAFERGEEPGAQVGRYLIEVRAEQLADVGDLELGHVRPDHS